jgi:hypothetical protein
MTTRAPEQMTSPAVVPAQARPVRTVRPSRRAALDYVCAHGRSCWWDVTECRWICGG